MYQQPPPPPIPPCPACGGPRVLTDTSSEVRWGVPSRLGRLFTSGHGFNVLICTNCGHSTFYAQNFQDLRQPPGR
ncbi:MAG TPA: hypothetical protein VH540_00690 [Ktedonobacterales bacterium]